MARPANTRREPADEARPLPEPPLIGGNVIAKLDRIYDLRRDCLLNELYYGRRLNFLSRSSLWLEIVIVIGSGVSGVSGWIIWTTYPALKAAWAGVAAAATFLAALKPVLHVDARVKRYSTLFVTYRQLSLGMADLVQDIAEAGGLTHEIEREANRLRTRYRGIAADDDPRPSPKTVQALQAEVNRRVSVDSFFYPGNPGTHDRRSAGCAVPGPQGSGGAQALPAQPSLSTDGGG